MHGKRKSILCLSLIKKEKRKKEKERYPSIEGEMPFRQIDYWLVMHQLLLNHKCKYYDKCKYMSSQA